MFKAKDQKIKDLETKVAKLEEIIDGFCDVYYKENKEQIEIRRSILWHAQDYYGEDAAIIKRYDLNKAKKDYADACNRLMKAREK